MKVSLLALVLVVGVASALEASSADILVFHNWAVKYGKAYKNGAEYDSAFHNFQASVKRVTSLNAKGSSAQYGLGKFADLSQEEFKARYLNARIPENLDKSRTIDSVDLINYRNKYSHGDVAPPATWDWRTKKAVTPVKDQGQCGSCWAFSVTENVESQWFLAGHTLPKLAPQQLVDCDPQSQGCNGGWPYWAFEYLMTAGGLEAESAYPYQGETGTCQFQSNQIVARVYNYSFVVPPCESGDCSGQSAFEDKIRQALTTIGPFSICVNAGTWSDYMGGVVDASNCDGQSQDLDHCVQLVGYDWDKQYWIVRNSWNTDWGVDGYIYLKTKENTCGMADVVTFGVVKPTL